MLKFHARFPVQFGRENTAYPNCLVLSSWTDDQILEITTFLLKLHCVVCVNHFPGALIQFPNTSYKPMLYCHRFQQQFVNKNAEATGFNPGLIVLLVVGGLLITFLVGNYVLYMYAQKTLPPRKKKPVSKKKLKREKLKQGVAVPGE